MEKNTEKFKLGIVPQVRSPYVQDRFAEKRLVSQLFIIKANKDKQVSFLANLHSDGCFRIFLAHRFRLKKSS